MLPKILEAVKHQRLAWSCAIIVGLFLTVIGRAPVLPVAAGCILAIGFAVMRAWPVGQARGDK